jgi:WD40 repeat protein
VVSVALGVDAANGGRLVVASGSRDKTVRLWDPTTGSPAGPVIAVDDWRWEPFGLAFREDVHRGLPGASGAPPEPAQPWVLAACGGGSSGWVFDVATGSPVLGPLLGHRYQVTSVAWWLLPSTGSPMLATAGADKTVRVWDAGTGLQHGGPLQGHIKDVTCVVALGPPGPPGPGGDSGARALLASGSEDGTVRLWDPVLGAQVGDAILAHNASVTCLAWGQHTGGDGVLVSGSGDGELRVWVWGAPAWQPTGPPLVGHGGGVTSVAVMAQPARLLVASGSSDNTARLWGLAPDGTASLLWQSRGEAMAMDARGARLRGAKGLAAHVVALLQHAGCAAAGEEVRLGEW